MLRHLARLHYKPSFSSKHCFRGSTTWTLCIIRGYYEVTAKQLSLDWNRQGCWSVAGLTSQTYCLADEYELDGICTKLPIDGYFVQNNYEDMLHISNAQSGGDVYLFSNGTVVFWGSDQGKQAGFLHFIRQQQSTSKAVESKEVVEYTIDEDEVTDMKGDIVILDPYIPSVDLSKNAFSHGLGRAAKLSSPSNPSTAI
ncbi:inc metabolism membrane protein [Mucor velutinosus]|uniref:Inc metabolism membrane protein n=1 Tax=Mucor velutinosus TaxID=708070 RepID=A0AAN7DCT0_9FUNG|nr:inc metabolism membrane protein [Mucor velutinosus]